MLYLSKSLVYACIAAARAAHPNESLALLQGRREANGDIYLDRLVIPPGLSVNWSSAHFLPWMLPTNLDHLGIFHSHPVGSAAPSRADILASGHEGGVQLILSSPYLPSSLRAYRPDGTPVDYLIQD